jgi:16S rRNA (cytosine1402-N4)-methyltransferase
LKPKGKLIIVSFHALEDRIVKNYFKNKALPKFQRSKYKIIKEEEGEKAYFNIVTKRPLTPSSKEVKENFRSRSAKMRIAEYIIREGE